MASPDPPSLVHIGYHKTGTTWFQKNFFPSVDSHHFIPSNRTRRALLFTYALDFDPSACRRQLGLDNQPPFIISEEKLCGSYENAGHFGALSKDLANRIYATAPEAHIVIFIRNQVEMLASLYAQYIKMGGTRRPRAFFFPRRYRQSVRRNPFKVPLFALEHFAYVGLIRHYQELFGEERVHIFPYEAFKADCPTFLADFADRFGITYHSEALNPTPVNTSYRDRTLKVARFLNHFSHRGAVDKDHWLTLPPKPIQKMPKWFNRTPLAGPIVTSETLLGTELITYIQDFYSATNRELAGITGLPLREYGYAGT